MAHYQHKKHDPKTGRFAKITPEPHKKPVAPQAPPIEAPETAQERRRKLLLELEGMTDADLEAYATREDARAAALAHASAVNARKALKRPAPDWVNDPRRLGDPGGEDGGYGSW